MIDKYPDVFTVAYLTAHFPKAIQAGKQAEEAPKNMGAGKPAAPRDNQRNAESSRHRDDRYHRDERSFQYRNDKDRSRSPRHRSRSWDHRDQKRLRSPYEQRERLRSPPRHSPLGQQRCTEEGESSSRNPTAAELHRDRIAQQQATRKQKASHAPDGQVNTANFIPTAEAEWKLQQQQRNKDLAVEITDKITQMRQNHGSVCQKLITKDRIIQCHLDETVRLKKLNSELQQRSSVPVATRDMSTQTSGPTPSSSRAKKSSRTTSSTAQNSAATEGEEEWRNMHV
jgi:hypothetical protein